MNEQSSKYKGRNVAIVALPFKNPGDIPPQTRPSRFAAVLSPLVEEVFIITGNFSQRIAQENVRVINVRTPVAKSLRESLVSKGFRFLSAQLNLSIAIFKLCLKSANKIDAIFFFGGEALLIPVLISKLLGKKVILMLRGSFERETQIQMQIFSKPLSYLKQVNMALSDNVIIYAECLISQWHLQRYRNKILVASYLFVDSDKFRPAKPLVERGNIIGYVGRLDREKGFLNFTQAMPRLFETEKGLNVLIVGDGQLRDEAEQYLERENLNDRVQFAGWIAHDHMPDYLNQLKLLVLPSYTEGLPNVILEAMACGTPVLTTSVGSIPDIITDSETGFIMEDNSPNCITKNIIRALSLPNLDEVSTNARTYAIEQCSFQAVLTRYRALLSELVSPN